MTKLDSGAGESAVHGIARSPHWPGVERAFRAAHPHCAACAPGTNTDASVQVHHVLPFHFVVALGRPDLELDPRNLITLCETEHERPGPNHHLLVGHLDDFKSSNLQVVLDATQTFMGMDAPAIKADHRWLSEKCTRLKRLNLMTDGEKADFVAAMNARFPQL